MNNIVTAAEFATRRKQLLAKMGPHTVAIVAAAPEYIRNGDGDYPYRQDSDFYYLTGFSEPGAIAVLMTNQGEGEFILFNRPRDPAQETWHGRRAGQSGAVEKYAADKAYNISEFAEKLPELLAGNQRIAYFMGRNQEFDKQILAAVNVLHGRARFGIVAPREFINLEQWLAPMRQIKSAHEADAMRRAAQISVAAHKRAMKICRPGMYEYQLEAELLHEFCRNGARSPAYNSIVGSGENTCILHYNENNTQIKDGDMVLIDAGCEFENYASDITRSFPANGKFNPEQRAIYELVLKAQLAAIEQAKPGNTLEGLHTLCVRILTTGLVELGLLHGNVDALIEQKEYMKFYMHRTGHWLGLDTHDVGLYRVGTEWMKFKPGMAHTIEPGIYIAANTPGVDKKWWNIGVRIEDDILITENGCEVLSKDVPKSVAEIEALMQQNVQ